LRALELRCASIGNWFPRRFPSEKLKRKFHLLTKEIPLFAAKWQTVGLASEQAVESSNRIFNRLDRTYATMGDLPSRLSATINQFTLESNPSVKMIEREPRLCSKCSQPIAKRFKQRCQCERKLRSSPAKTVD